MNPIATPVRPETPPPAQAPTSAARSEWRVDEPKTANGAAVLSIGRPRLRIGQPTLNNEMSGTRFVAFDGEAFRVWDTVTGVEAARLAFAAHEWMHLYDPVVLWVTSEARTVIGGYFFAPQRWTLPYGISRSFSTDRHVVGLLMDASIVVLNKKVIERRALDTNAVIASVPAPARAWDVLAVVKVGEEIYWFQRDSSSRWDHASNTVVSVAKAPHEWRNVRVREGSSLAVARGASGVDRVNLVDGTVTPLPEVTVVQCLLPGDRLVYAEKSDIRTIELRTLTRVSEMRAAVTVEQLVCGDDGSFAYIAGHEVHIVDASGTERAMSTPARFAGWGPHGTVVVDDHGPSWIDLATVTATAGGTPEAAVTVATDVVTTAVEPHTVTVRVGGATRATLHVRSPPGDPDLYERRYLAAAADARHAVVVWYQPDLERDGRLGTQSDQEEGAQYCAEHDRFAPCVMEYFAEVWTVEAKPRRLWTTRFNRALPTLRRWPFPKEATAVGITHDGKGALFGFRDGDVIVADVATGAMHTESLHYAPISRIETSPDDTYVLTQDLADEQRVWPLAYWDRRAP